MAELRGSSNYIAVPSAAGVMPGRGIVPYSALCGAGSSPLGCWLDITDLLIEPPLEPLVPSI